jgi:hypothetical protein
MMNKNVIVKIKMPFLHIAHHLEKVNLNCNKETFKLAAHSIASILHVIT